jgi:hypothetical protein
MKEGHEPDSARFKIDDVKPNEPVRNWFCPGEDDNRQGATDINVT